MKKLLCIYHLPNHQANHQSVADKKKSVLPIDVFKHKLLYFICLFSLLGVSTPTLALNKIQVENAQPGNTDWYLFHVLGTDAADNPHDLEGYADKDSVNVGQPISFFVNANPARNRTYKIRIYRLGWYGGYGARKFHVSPALPTVSQVIPASDPTTGLVQANWTNPYTITIPGSWVSGIYIATITNNTGNQRWEGQYIPFVVKDSNRSSDYLFQASTTTWQAYNGWGGKSLYGYNSGNSPARKISFNRPYDVGGGLGSLLNWEINMLYFMEREGYDVTYQSNTDTHALVDGGLLNHRAVLSVGHDEYWSKEMRDNFEKARAHGIGLGFFGSNTAYWQIRFENNNRTIVGYKDFSAAEDPLAIDGDPSNNNLVTGRWRDPLWANRPENALLGVMYAFGPKGNSELDSDIIMSKADPKLLPPNDPEGNWIYTATSMPKGTVFPRLLGYEADRVFDNGLTPAGLQIVGASPVPLGVVDHNSPLSANYDPNNPKSHMTVYEQPCTVSATIPFCRNPKSTVFATGSMQYVWGLDAGFKADDIHEIPAVQQTTRNILARLVSAKLPVEISPTLPATLAAKSAQALSARDSNPQSMEYAVKLLSLLDQERQEGTLWGGGRRVSN